MEAILRASLSLDGKLLTAGGKPSRREIPLSRVKSARELRLTIHPLIAGGVNTPTLSGLPGAFLPQDVEWELVSTTNGRDGAIKVRYQRKRLREKRASRQSPPVG